MKLNRNWLLITTSLLLLMPFANAKENSLSIELGLRELVCKDGICYPTADNVREYLINLNESGDGELEVPAKYFSPKPDYIFATLLISVQNWNNQDCRVTRTVTWQSPANNHPNLPQEDTFEQKCGEIKGESFSYMRSRFDKDKHYLLLIVDTFLHAQASL
jgi:hypothetical protein